MVADHERGVIGTRPIENIGIIHVALSILTLAIGLVHNASDTLLGHTGFFIHAHKLALFDILV